MEYLALIYADEAAWERFSDAERAAAYEQYGEFAKAAGAAGVLVGGEELGPTSSRDDRARPRRSAARHGRPLRRGEGGARRLLRPRLRRRSTTRSSWAARIPGASHGAVEVRPVHVDEEA